jgi:hypothetical protein
VAVPSFDVTFVHLATSLSVRLEVAHAVVVQGVRTSIRVSVLVSPTVFDAALSCGAFHLRHSDLESAQLEVGLPVRLDLHLDPLLWDALPESIWAGQGLLAWLSDQPADHLVWKGHVWSAWAVHQSKYPGISSGVTTRWARPGREATDAAMRRLLASRLGALKRPLELVDPHTFAIEWAGRALDWVALIAIVGDSSAVRIQSVYPGAVDADAEWLEGEASQLRMVDGGVLVHEDCLALPQAIRGETHQLEQLLRQRLSAAETVFRLVKRRTSNHPR